MSEIKFGKNRSRFWSFRKIQIIFFYPLTSTFQNSTFHKASSVRKPRLTIRILIHMPFFYENSFLRVEATTIRKRKTYSMMYETLLYCGPSRSFAVTVPIGASAIWFSTTFIFSIGSKIGLLSLISMMLRVKEAKKSLRVLNNSHRNESRICIIIYNYPKLWERCEQSCYQWPQVRDT